MAGVKASRCIHNTYPSAKSQTSLWILWACNLKGFLSRLLAFWILQLTWLRVWLEPSLKREPSTGELFDHPLKKSPIERRVDIIDQACLSGQMDWCDAWNLRNKVLQQQKEGV